MKKFDDNFSHVDRMHQRDEQTDRLTDGRTPGDSKDRAYGQRRAVKTQEKNRSLHLTLATGRRAESSLYLGLIGSVNSHPRESTADHQ